MKEFVPPEYRELFKSVKETIISLPKLPALIREELAVSRGELIYDSLAYPAAGAVFGYYMLREDIPVGLRVAAGTAFGLFTVGVGMTRRRNGIKAY